MLPYQKPTALPLLYHLNSEPWMNFEAYADHPYDVEFKHRDGIGEPVKLPASGQNSALDRLFARRRSCRSFAQTSLPAPTLGALLTGAYGLTNAVTVPNGFRFHSRPVPSAGGLYPLELYLITNRVDGIEDRVYHFEAAARQLRPIAPKPSSDELARMLLTQQFLENANVIIFITAVFDRTLSKYGSRGYRYVLLEAGHVAQNLCLLAAEMELGSLCAGGFWDSRLNRFLGLNGVDEAAIYCVGVGGCA